MPYLLKVISGPDEGLTYPLASTTTIGRSSKAQLKLSNPTISWEHALITRTGEEFFVENLSAVGTMLNDTKLTAKTKLRLRDQLKIADDTVVRVDPADGSSASLFSNPKFLGTAIAVLIVVAVALIFLDPFSGTQRDPNWPQAYATVFEFVQRQAAPENHQLPAEAPMLLRDAWRLDSVGDFKASQPVWLRLQLLLDSQKQISPALRDAEKHAKDSKHASPLDRILTAKPTDPPPTDDDLAAATLEFSSRRLAFANKKVPVTGFFK